MNAAQADSKTRLCVIPARGGSKRLPRKNILRFHGQPMLAYALDAARNSGCFGRILVSSEDEETLELARSLGALVSRRDAALAGDEATVVAVLLDILEREACEGRRYETICCLYPAAPLRRAGDVAAVVALIEPGRCDFAMAVTEYGLPPHQALKLDEEDMLAPLFPELVTLRDDQLGRVVVDNGSTYAAAVEAFRRQRNFYGPGLKGHLMPRSRSIDINTAEDLALADFFFARGAA